MLSIKRNISTNCYLKADEIKKKNLGGKNIYPFK